jgi:ribonuclease E
MDKSNKMLIDATHPEETRVVVLRNGRVEEFDYESAARKQLRGNIYLAKVTRVEPSLQAAFVDYGGNRHGFLAFSEIHPDYYQIPVADRQALLQEEAAAAAEAEAEADARAEAAARRAGDPSSAEEPAERAMPARSDDDWDRRAGEDTSESELAPGEEQDHVPDARHDDRQNGFDNGYVTNGDAAEDTPRASPEAAEAGSSADTAAGAADAGAGAAPAASFGGDFQGEPAQGNGEEGGTGYVEEIAGDPAEAPETVSTVEGGEAADAMEEVPERPRRRMRAYKIQEVIKRRQIILVQVVKEERGSKGAALTTYLSLAGRYTVLMPNTGRGGGISRKITNPQDRKRLKAIANDLEVPEGMGLIIRTAGAARTKQEIKRDFEYEIRLWENVRDLTLTSTAPCLVYEEGNLIKRSLRDLYTKDLDEILVAGGAAHEEAHTFMGMLSPGQAKSVVRYDEPEPLFSRYQIERQLNAMFSPYVTLRSGGYLVINQTEALVSIDVNSGKATREFSIEETALHTNLEAAEEIARQLKLRDLAGLIVIDFIDMEERRNNRKVENRLKDALRHDRARIQVGRISHFGLLEMSRQRLRTGVLEGSTTQCPHCQGTGIIRSVESVALAVLRALEDQLLRDARNALTAVTTAEAALYILNNKRAFVTDMEKRYGVAVMVQASDRMQGANFAIERASAQPSLQRAAERTVVNMESGFSDPADAEAEEEPAETRRANGEGSRDRGWERDEEGRRGRGRRRRRGRREERHEPRGERMEASTEAPGQDEQPAGEEEFVPGRAAQEAAEHPGSGEQPSIDGGEDQDRRGRRRRRGRRGGRRGRGQDEARDGAPHVGADDAPIAARTEPEAGDDHPAHDTALPAAAASAADRGEGEQEDAPSEAPRAAAELAEVREEAARSADDDTLGERAWEGPVEAAGNGARHEEPSEAHAETPVGGGMAYRAEADAVTPDAQVPEDPPQPARKGWWQRRFSA